MCTSARGGGGGGGGGGGVDGGGEAEWLRSGAEQHKADQGCTSWQVAEAVAAGREGGMERGKKENVCLQFVVGRQERQAEWLPRLREAGGKRNNRHCLLGLMRQVREAREARQARQAKRGAGVICSGTREGPNGRDGAATQRSLLF
ncbi:hypothetical protein E2C01_051700 [Portunus trituberculatus]|uniref:Uncharacterized protein n=1 Tax=Portunus trituberculatus TaxID=210409 RepID=A0A5B7GJS3_PORTR|nr:hypothetical protein [Portunus trituberculatus]